MKTITVAKMTKDVQAKIEAAGFVIVYTMFKSGMVVVAVK